MKFEELTDASRQAAREVLADMLKTKYQHDLCLHVDEINNLSHKVREAFVALESEEPSVMSDSDCLGEDGGRCGSETEGVYTSLTIPEIEITSID
ncbi:hypothetical protein KKJ06_18325 [Xenorhabdus bovienii]|uniref:hypothetical protein n=1 Tax=Xenorhabdus bovienii TaxID=40576 RepID=UPI0023B34B7B|nr:hypothetical protein [Xenorhabdus bovienii]MDE9557321.1 hypothetical protein [Xenorhabdus bovienii]